MATNDLKKAVEKFQLTEENENYPYAVDYLMPDHVDYGRSVPEYPRDIVVDRCTQKSCNRKIKHRVIVKVGRDEYRCMGRRCASKLVDPAEGLIKRYKRDHPKFLEWLKDQPHPKRWRGKSRLDYVIYMAINKSANFLHMAFEEYEDEIKNKSDEANRYKVEKNLKKRIKNFLSIAKRTGNAQLKNLYTEIYLALEDSDWDPSVLTPMQKNLAGIN